MQIERGGRGERGRMVSSKALIILSTGSIISLKTTGTEDSSRTRQSQSYPVTYVKLAHCIYFLHLITIIKIRSLSQEYCCISSSSLYNPYYCCNTIYYIIIVCKNFSGKFSFYILYLMLILTALVYRLWYFNAS